MRLHEPASYAPPTPEVLHKLELSAAEVQDEAPRAIRCPYCSFLIAYAYSDARGHYHARCGKCKRIMAINFAYFRRQKHFKKTNHYDF